MSPRVKTPPTPPTDTALVSDTPTDYAHFQPTSEEFAPLNLSETYLRQPYFARRAEARMESITNF